MPREINVVSATQRISVNPTTRSVSITLAGPMGPTGPTGGISQAELDAAVAGLQSQINNLQAQVDTYHQ